MFLFKNNSCPPAVETSSESEATVWILVRLWEETDDAIVKTSPQVPRGPRSSSAWKNTSVFSKQAITIMSTVSSLLGDRCGLLIPLAFLLACGSSAHTQQQILNSTYQNVLLREFLVNTGGRNFTSLGPLDGCGCTAREEVRWEEPRLVAVFLVCVFVYMAVDARLLLLFCWVLRHISWVFWGWSNLELGLRFL